MQRIFLIILLLLFGINAQAEELHYSIEGKIVFPPEGERQEGQGSFERAWRFQERGMHTRAIRSYKRAIQQNPNFVEAYTNLGYCYAMKQRYAEAVESLERAIELEPEFIPAHEYLGEVYLKMGDIASAQQEYEILKTLDAAKAEKLLEEIQKITSE